MSRDESNSKRLRFHRTPRTTDAKLQVDNYAFTMQFGHHGWSCVLGTLSGHGQQCHIVPYFLSNSWVTCISILEFVAIKLIKNQVSEVGNPSLHELWIAFQSCISMMWSQFSSCHDNWMVFFYLSNSWIKSTNNHENHFFPWSSFLR